MKRTYSSRSIGRSDTLPLPQRKKTTLSRQRTSIKRAVSRSFSRNKRALVTGNGMSNVLSNQAFTLFTSPAPYPDKLTKVLTWRGAPYYSSSAITNGGAFRLVVNGYSPDYDVVFGSGNPLHFSNLCASSGPYQNYIVKRWSVSWQIINAHSYEMEALVDQGTFVTDSDTLSEIRTRPNVMRQILSASGTDAARTEIICSGTTNEFRPDKNDFEELAGNSATNPADPIYQTFLFNHLRGVSSSYVVVIPTLTQEIMFFNKDTA